MMAERKESGRQVRRPKHTREEDYGNRGLHRQAGSTKAESLQTEGVDTESRDKRWTAKKPAARKGRKVARGQTVEERQTITRGDRRR